MKEKKEKLYCQVCQTENWCDWSEEDFCYICRICGNSIY